MKKLQVFILIVVIFMSSCKNDSDFVAIQNIFSGEPQYSKEYNYKIVEKKYVASDEKIGINYPQFIGLKDSSFEKLLNDAVYIYSMNNYFDSWSINNLNLQVGYSIEYIDKNYISFKFTGKGDAGGSRCNYVQYGVNLDLHNIGSAPSFRRISIYDIVQIQSLYDAISNENFRYMGIIEAESKSVSGEELARMLQLSLENKQYNEVTNFSFDNEGLILMIDDIYPHIIRVDFDDLMTNLQFEDIKE